RPFSASHSIDGARPVSPSWPAEVRAGHAAMYNRNGHSQLAVPIVIQDKVVCALGFSAPANRPHTSANLELPEHLAHRIAPSIEKAGLYDGTQQGLRARDEFLSVAAQELRGPLSTMKLAVQTLRRPDLAGDTRERMLELVEREDQRLAQFAEEITDITRIRSG